ncbi:glycerophosphodiester phosphodiesterase GDPDL4-like [Cucumis melo var. makuwa]|uniref:glycerophosphodiester phosphodiesterase n=1 Tax=Cucumis melo var. makuwa TaxID=1194695 RepID=A0A5A7U3D1_CUCMM|nr:glycerophosphodiester phosphodiesterase GDPDL4-like [Cucumis melo var. makuwa]TYK08091.1 glycerophosphodiester phosphodiesterase GDPDL4-like [Cucumis melo var. makuwa]
MSSSSRSLLIFFSLFLHSFLALVSAQGSNSTALWQTLSGDAPFVVARGGFSGLFPDSSGVAYNFAVMVSVPDVILWCDVQLTKDGVGICLPDLKLDNATDAPTTLGKNRTSSYLVNGVRTSGLFTVDFDFKELENVSLVQGIYSRSTKFDGNQFVILTAEDVANQFKPPGFWLNIQHDVFFTQHNASMRNFVLSVTRRIVVNYISSPEVGFLRSIAARVPRTTKLILRFLGPTDTEITTNQTYGSLLRNLTFIKTFASGILVPKTYIWPMGTDGYVQAQTPLVSDAHKAELEVFASEFFSDLPLGYNYSYDPVTEYLSYFDNGKFSVDGVLSDFPITPSSAIDCFAHLDKNAKSQAKPLVISKFGASGDYPGCTDLAYTNAISDGVEVLDCPVQITKDGIPFCMSSINLIDSTTISQSPFINRSKNIPEISPNDAIFAFDLTWEEIQSLSPSILSPYSSKYALFRNPRFRNKGNFTTLPDFLAMAKNAGTLSGVLIQIENAAYLAKDQGLSVTDAVLSSLSKAGYDNQTAVKVLIQSPDSAVLMKFKQENKNYELVYKVDPPISDVLNTTVEDIKSFADSVTITKNSVFPVNQFFLTGATNVVKKLKALNLSVYVDTFSNEFVSQAWDFFSDATVEINSFVLGAEIDGVITDFPKTSARYKKNRCLAMKETPNYMSPVQPGSLLQLVTPNYLPPKTPPSPVLDDKDVAEPPLPPVSAKPPAPAGEGGSTAAPPTSKPNGQPKLGAGAGFLLLNLAILSIALLPF